MSSAFSPECNKYVWFENSHLLFFNFIPSSLTQFNISDTPDNYSFVGVEGTERVGDFAVSGSNNNGMSIVGFSFTGGVILPGTGAIAIVEMSNDSAQDSLEISINIPNNMS